MPRKNIKEFLGKPLLAWTIEVAKESGVLDRIILSTEDREIAEAGKRYGAEVPFMRPMALAQDSTPALPVVQHAIRWLKDNEKYEVDWIIFLEPSSPGRQAFHIQEVIRLLEQNNEADSFVGVSELPGHFSPLKALQRNNRGMVSRYGDGELIRNLTHRNQDLPSLYFINSAIYAFKVSNIFKDPASLWGSKVFGYIMEPRYALDIDTQDDWVVAEAKMRLLLASSRNRKSF
ncbi:MAG: acylneuraminate cytidylyltransferase family protein [Candidatus Spechtbacteria bacterium]|nr:acylneuraminate cytidylyltransferase family protein [Candidatus Spechtbacteria bacterium]